MKLILTDEKQVIMQAMLIVASIFNFIVLIPTKRSLHKVETFPRQPPVLLRELPQNMGVENLSFYYTLSLIYING